MRPCAAAGALLASRISSIIFIFSGRWAISRPVLLSGVAAAKVASYDMNVVFMYTTQTGNGK